ncbi:MAG: DivIVA domain-containing protein [Bacteroidia bacterium]|nr:DivIVA domain-containing protein [Bacteroidia bacterium]
MDANTLANKEFSTSRKGWNPDEVRPYLRALAEELAALADENDALRREVVTLEQQLRQSKDTEKRIRAMLGDLKSASEQLAKQTEAGVLASTMRVEQERKVMIEQAKREADIIIRDAERRSERIVAQGNERYARLQEQIDLLEAKKIAIVTRIRSILRAEVDFLASFEQGGQGRAIRSAILPGGKTREGINTDELHDIIQRLDQYGRTDD